MTSSYRKKTYFAYGNLLMLNNIKKFMTFKIKYENVII